MQTIDYSKYSYHELHEALNAVDQEQFPDNYQAIITELEARKASVEIETFDVKPTPYFAGFWRRVFAHIIDILLLSSATLLLGSLLFDSMVAIGYFGLLIGFIFSALYFTLGYSHALGGQTPGKMLVDIKVTDKNGQPLTLASAFIRFLVIDFSFYTSYSLLLWANFNGTFVFAFGLISNLVLLASIYLLIFNRPSRRTLHDYLAGSIVVRIDIEQQTHKPLWKGHFAFLIPLLFLVILSSYFKFLKENTQQEMLNPIKESIESQTDYSVKQLTYSESSHPAFKGRTFKTLIINVHTGNPDIDLEKMSDEVTTLVREHPDAAGFNNVYLVVSTGFNLGIAHLTHQESTFIQL